MFDMIKQHLRKSKYAFIFLWLYRPIYNWKWRERRIFTGGSDNLDKTFFVIRRAGRHTDIFSNFLVFLGWINYAREKGYIPVIDMMSYPNVYLYANQIGKLNAWEFFFKQPYCDNKRYSVEDVYKSKNVILSSGVKYPYMPVDSLEFLENPSKVNFWNELYIKCLEFSDDASKYINEQCESLFNKRKKFLGIHCRGTGYRLLRSSPKNSVGNPLQPSIDKMLERACEVKRMHNCDGVFLATEDVEYFNIFKEFFGSDLFTVNTEYIDAKNIDLIENTDTNFTTDRIDDKRLRGLEYITAMIAYSNCDYRISGINSGTIAALIINPKQSGAFYYDEGRGAK